MRLAFIPFFLSICLLCFQSPAKSKIEWFPGLVKLNSGEQLKGDVNYNEELDIVSFRGEGKIKAFTASKVASFQFYDSWVEEVRSFVSLDYNYNLSYKKVVFFEVVLLGQVSIFRRYKTFNQFYSLRSEGFADNFGSYAYYALNNGKLVNLKAFKKQLLPELKGRYHEELSSFVEVNQLKARQIEHQIAIIDYYNFLVDPKRKVLNNDQITRLN